MFPQIAFDKVISKCIVIDIASDWKTHVVYYIEILTSCYSLWSQYFVNIIWGEFENKKTRTCSQKKRQKNQHSEANKRENWERLLVNTIWGCNIMLNALRQVFPKKKPLTKILSESELFCHWLTCIDWQRHLKKVFLSGF